jgi:glycosyltransferase involved in cell wall biosynthesis
LLAKSNIDYSVVYSDPYGAFVQKNDSIEIDWGRKAPLSRLGDTLVMQWALFDLSRADLIILQQESRLLINYPCQILGRAGLRKVAFFGHGRNFQAMNRNSAGERWKRFWATKVDWWFGYTAETKSYIAALGFPAERITVFNNAVDTSEIDQLASEVTSEELARARQELGLIGENVGIYVGGLYAEKRLSFLMETLDLIHTRLATFEFIAVGGGPELPYLRSAAATRPWLKVTGPQFGREKVKLMALGHVFLIPGLVGLAILDAGIMGLPLVTTNYPFHSPEIAYLQEGRNGVMVRPWNDTIAYATAVIEQLTAGCDRRLEMRREARRIARGYTVDAMAENCASGIVEALEMPKR